MRAQVMRKDRVLERDHHDYVRAERDVLTAVVHPYVVTLRYSFQVSERERCRSFVVASRCGKRRQAALLVPGDHQYT